MPSPTTADYYEILDGIQFFKLDVDTRLIPNFTSALGIMRITHLYTSLFKITAPACLAIIATGGAFSLAGSG